jgi:hypothetical protein
LIITSCMDQIEHNMKRIIGIILFAFGSLVVLAYAGLIIYTVITAFHELDDPGLQVVLAIPLIIVVPCFFLAGLGWKFIFPKSIWNSNNSQIQIEKICDPSEIIVSSIETANEKALFFTSKRMIVAHVEGLGNSGSGGSTNDLFGLISSISLAITTSTAGRKVKKLSQILPDSVLTEDMRYFDVPYSSITSIRIYRKFLWRRIRLLLNNPVKSSLVKMVPGGYTLEFRLNHSRQWKKYQADLSDLMPGKVENQNLFLLA